MNLKNIALEFRYKAAQQNPTLKSLIEKYDRKRSDFEMARFIIQKYPQTISREDMKYAQYYLVPRGYGKNQYRDMRQSSIKLLNEILQSPFSGMVDGQGLTNLLGHACVEHDLEMVKKILEFPRAVEMPQHEFYHNSLYYVLPASDPRRKEIDSRNSEAHRQEGSPEIVALIEAFDLKRRAYQAQQSTTLKVPTKPAPPK